MVGNEATSRDAYLSRPNEAEATERKLASEGKRCLPYGHGGAANIYGMFI